MREIAAIFEKGFTLGLRTYENHPRNTDALVECMDMVPNPLGVIGRPVVFNPFEGDFVIDWPFPLIVRTVRYTFLITRTKVYTMDDQANLTLLGSASFSDQPHIADFGDTVYFAASRVYQLSPAGFKEMPSEYKFSTCVNYGGQLIVANGAVPKGVALGGRSGSNAHSVIVNATDVSGPGMIAWSKINALDFEFDLSLESGFAEAMWNGEVYKFLSLGDEIVAYGDAGIAKMKPFSTPVPSFGFSNFSKFGILNRNAVAGDGQMHICIGNDLSLYSVQPQRALSDTGYAPKPLGYKEYISKLVHPVISFEPIHRHWWICGSNGAFILSESGLGEASDSSTNVVSVNGFPWGVTTQVAERGARVTTDLISFGTRGIKLLAAIELDMECLSDVFCQTQWRVDYRKPLTDGLKIFVDPRGSVFPTAAGTEYRIRVMAEDFTSLHLSRLRLRYKTVDRQSTRGVVNAGKTSE